MGVLKLFELASRMDKVGVTLTRVGLIVVLLWIGGLKVFPYEADGIVPFVANSPLMSWVYGLISVRGCSAMLGVVEVTIALLIAARPFSPRVSALGSALAVGMFLTTLSFLVTTPGVWDPSSPWGGFLMKDVMLLGAALYTAAEALEAAARRT